MEVVLGGGEGVPVEDALSEAREALAAAVTVGVEVLVAEEVGVRKASTRRALLSVSHTPTALPELSTATPWGAKKRAEVALASTQPAAPAPPPARVSTACVDRRILRTALLPVSPTIRTPAEAARARPQGEVNVALVPMALPRPAKVPPAPPARLLTVPPLPSPTALTMLFPVSAA